MSLTEDETLDEARQGIGGYVDRYPPQTPSGRNYPTPSRCARPGRMDNDYRNPRPSLSPH
jgi:hypothetical protein